MIRIAFLAIAAILAGGPAFADEAAVPPPPALDSGNTAWMLVSTALVLMMTVPGVALFYGGMVRKKNVLATVMQSFAVTCVITILWIVAGIACYWGASGLKHMCGYDDSLDAFGVHGVGGIVGAILTGVFAVEAIGGTPGALEGNAGQVLTQIYGVAVTMPWRRSSFLKSSTG